MSEQTKLSVIEVAGVADLYKFYVGQSSPQDCYIELDPEAQTVRADWNGEIGNAVPSTVWHGLLRRYQIPCVNATAANSIMSELLPLLQRICDGYEKVWNGNNYVGCLSFNAQQAEEQIEYDLYNNQNDYDDERIRVADAYDYYYDARNDLGITADTTDEELDDIEKNLEEENDEYDVIERLREFLENLRNNEINKRN